MKKILIASRVSPHVLETLSRDYEIVEMPGASEAELADAIVDCHALAFRSGVDITADVLDRASSLQVIVRAGSGYDNIDLDALGRKVVHFFRVPGPGAKAVAEMAFTLMLALARDLLWADREWRRGNWVKSQASGALLSGKVLGVVGAGNIGSRTGQLGAAWGMEALGCIEHPGANAAALLADKGVELVDFETILARSDFLSVHVPLQDSTDGLIGAREFAAMKPGAYLVNLSRGGVVDELALLEALESGHLAGAALDVHVAEGDGNISPLAHLPNVILTPHIGATTRDSQREIGDILVRCIRFAEENPPSTKATEDNFIVM